MKRAFQVSITLSLAAFLLLPMPGHTASLDHRIQVELECILFDLCDYAHT